MFSVIYKWTYHTDTDATEHDILPLYGKELTKKWTKENGRKFFRTSLDGKIKFLNEDFDTFEAMPITTKVFVTLYISYNHGSSWSVYQECFFYKTDCTWNYDDRIAEVTLQSSDNYNEILDGIDNEYNLIELAPDMQTLTYKRRPVIQQYLIGADTCAMFIDTLYWEQPVNEIVDSNATMLQNHFLFIGNKAKATVSGTGVLGLDGEFYSVDNVGSYPQYFYEGYLTNGSNVKVYIRMTSGTLRMYITKDNDTIAFGNINNYGQETNYYVTTLKDFHTLQTISGEVRVQTAFLYSRLLLAEDFGGSVVRLSDDDPIGGNFNYPYALTNPPIHYNPIFSFETQATATEYGRAADGNYWSKPSQPNIVPISRNSWSFVSVWSGFYNIPQFSSERILNDAYTLDSCINVLLRKIAPNIDFRATAEYSEFLYGDSPVRQDDFLLYITAKTNILVSEYDAPAKRMPCSLSTILNMLRDTFKLYWFVEDGKLRIEHEYFFNNGGSYSVIPSVSYDIATDKYAKNGKPYAFGQNKISYEKTNLPHRYEFAWSEECTTAFQGLPIDVKGGFVDTSQIEQTAVNGFCADIDYGIANAENLSKDGMYIIAAVNYSVPIVERLVNGVNYRMQNGYMAFSDLQPKYWLYDMPAKDIVVNGQNATAVGISRHKVQELKLPAFYDFDTKKMIKTTLGNGEIDSLSINLESRSSILKIKYETEEL